MSGPVTEIQLRPDARLERLESLAPGIAHVGKRYRLPDGSHLSVGRIVDDSERVLSVDFENTKMRATLWFDNRGRVVEAIERTPDGAVRSLSDQRAINSILGQLDRAIRSLDRK